MQAELPTSTELHAIKNLKQIAREEFILPGTSICSGLEALRLAAKVLGPKTVFVNAAGCLPNTPTWRWRQAFLPSRKRSPRTQPMPSVPHRLARILLT